MKPKHPIQKTGLRIYAFAGLFGVFALLCFVVGIPVVGATFGVLTAIYVWIGYISRRNGSGVALHNTAYERASRGLIEEAEALSAQIPERAKRRGTLARAQGLLHGIIAFHRGRFAEGIVHATRAIEAKGEGLSFIAAPHYATAGRGLRALMHASLGNESAARPDIAAVDKSPHVHPAVWARCRLAEAILASRHEEHREALVRILREGRRGVGYLTPRERVLFRALERMVRIDARGAYREPGQRVEQAEARGLSDWVSHIVPGAAEFVKEERQLSAAAVEVELPQVERKAQAQELAEASVKAVRKPPPVKGRAAKGVAVWLAVVGIVGVIYSLLGTSSSNVNRSTVYAETPEAPLFSALELVGWAPAFLLAIAIAIVVLRIRAQRNAAAELVAAEMLKMRGKNEEYTRVLDRMAGARTPSIAATSLLSRAHQHEEAGRFPEALADIDSAIAKLHTQRSQTAAHDLLLPEIITERAFLLSVLGRAAEAELEHANLVRDFPSYPFAARANLRIRVALALHDGDEARARTIAQARTMETPMFLRDELLYDLLDLAANTNPSRDELARMNEEFAHQPRLVSWLDRVAPGLRERALRIGGARVSVPSAEAPAEEADLLPGALATQRGAV